MIIYVDIDKTICTGATNPVRAEPIQENIRKINKLYQEGHQIIYWTARGTVSGIDWQALTAKQLASWGAMHHDLRFGKPYYDLFIDDKAATIDDLECLSLSESQPTTH